MSLSKEDPQEVRSEILRSLDGARRREKSETSRLIRRLKKLESDEGYKLDSNEASLVLESLIWYRELVGAELSKIRELEEDL